MATTEIGTALRHFTIEVPGEDLADLRQRIQSLRD
jgi:hypothetical protein